jgi:hypothetical protein
MNMCKKLFVIVMDSDVTDPLPNEIISIRQILEKGHSATLPAMYPDSKTYSSFVGLEVFVAVWLMEDSTLLDMTPRHWVLSF